MALSNEDKSDVKAAFGKKVAGAVDKATHDGGKAKSPLRIELGEKAKSNFGYTIEDHKGNILKQGGSHAKKKDMAKKMKSDDVFARNKKKATSTPMHKWMSQFD